MANNRVELSVNNRVEEVHLEATVVKEALVAAVAREALEAARRDKTEKRHHSA